MQSFRCHVLLFLLLVCSRGLSLAFGRDNTPDKIMNSLVLIVHLLDPDLKDDSFRMSLGRR